MIPEIRQHIFNTQSFFIGGPNYPIRFRIWRCLYHLISGGRGRGYNHDYCIYCSSNGVPQHYCINMQVYLQMSDEAKDEAMGRERKSSE